MIKNLITFFLPQYGFRPADKHNASQYWFSWMFLQVWSMESFCFGVDLDVSFSRIGFGVILPYLRIWFGTSHFFYEPLANLEQIIRRKPLKEVSDAPESTFI